MLGRSRNANVSSAAFVRNTVIRRPPAPWVEPLAAPAPALVCFDVNRKVSRVPEGSCQRWRMVCLAGFGRQRRSSGSPDGPVRGGRGRKGPCSLERASGRITERLKCFLCGPKKPKKCPHPNLSWSLGAVWKWNSSSILKNFSSSWALSVSLLSLTCTIFFQSLSSTSFIVAVSGN